MRAARAVRHRVIVTGFDDQGNRLVRAARSFRL
jgi:hypothetical protein